MKKTRDYGRETISTDLDTFLRLNVSGAKPTPEWLKKTTSELKRLVAAHMPKDEFRTFVETWTFGDTFRCMIGFRRLDKENFSFINCSTGMEGKMG